MSITNSQNWGEVERLAREHEARVSAAMTAAGLPPLVITVQDRMRGAILSAIADIESGCLNRAVKTLEGAIRL